MHKFPLRRREIIALLEANGFQEDRRHGSHIRFRGVLGGRTRYPEVDQGIDEYPAERHRVLGHILAQLGFLDDDIPPNIGWERFYAGERRIAQRAQVQFRPWNDSYWAQWYG